MINMENVTTVITGWGNRRYQCTCERCGRKFTLQVISNRTSPLCGRCRNEDVKVKSATRRQAELDEAYQRGYADALKACGVNA